MRSSVQTSFLAGPSLVGYSPSVRQGEGRVGVGEGRGGGGGWDGVRGVMDRVSGGIDVRTWNEILISCNC